MKNLMKPFSISIFAHCEAINTGGLTPAQTKAHLNTVSDILKKAGDLHPSGASKAAMKIFKGISPNEDLRDKTWHEQHSFDKGRKIFHREHAEPVRSLRDMCLKAKNAEEVHKILIEKTRIIWVLKSEDKILTKLGYRTIRPDWKKAYSEAKIDHVAPKSGWPVY